MKFHAAWTEGVWQSRLEGALPSTRMQRHQGQNLSSLSHIPSYVGAMLSGAIGIALLDWLAKPPVKKDSRGRVRLRPSIGVYIFGLAAVVLAVALTGLAMTIFDHRPQNAQEAGSFLIIVLLATVSWCAVYGCLVVQVTFDSRGVEYRGLFRTINVTWAEVRRAVDSDVWGPYLSTNRGTLYIPGYSRGCAQLLIEARRQGVKVTTQRDD